MAKIKRVIDNLPNLHLTGHGSLDLYNVVILGSVDGPCELLDTDRTALTSREFGLQDGRIYSIDNRKDCADLARVDWPTGVFSWVSLLDIIAECNQEQLQDALYEAITS